MPHVPAIDLQASKDRSDRALVDSYIKGQSDSCFARVDPAGLRSVAKEAADSVYDERARVLAVATKMAQSLGLRCGLARHPDSDETWDDDWRTIVFLDLPTGQASWHLHDSQVAHFDHLGPYDGGPWDGHSTVDKYDRCEAFCATPGAGLPPA